MDKRTTGAEIERITDTWSRQIMENGGGSLTAIQPRVHDALMEFYELAFPGCRACADEGHHAARAEMCHELLKLYKDQAGALFANEQDNEALYIRTMIVGPLRAQLAEEREQVTKFGAGFHTCTLTGLHPF